MFEIFGALFGGLYLGARYLSEKSAEWEYKDRERANLQTYADFEKKYGDPILESELRHDLYDPEKRDVLWAEVSGVLCLLEGWQDYSKTDFDKQSRDINDKYFYESDQLAVDILMTNRGKLSKSVMGQPWWYPHYTMKCCGNGFMERHRLARWVVTKIHEFYPELTLYAETSAYGWDGHNKPNHSTLVEPYTQTWDGAYYDKNAANHNAIRCDVERELKIQFGLKSFLRTSLMKENADFGLEAAIKTNLRDQTTQIVVWKEIEPILHSLKSWSDFSEEEFLDDLRSKNSVNGWGSESIALDIIMAQHGKVPIRRLSVAYCYYPSIYDDSTEQYANRTIELIKWLADTLQKNASHLEIVCCRSIWTSFYIQGVGSGYGEVTPVNMMK